MKATSSLLKANNPLSDTVKQKAVLDSREENVLSFDEKIKTFGFSPLRTSKTEILQINLGKMCNQVCDHCHVDAGPDRKEIMTKETMLDCLRVLKDSEIKTVDLTGGAPEMNPEFTWFVQEIHKLKKEIIVRSNLTYITSNKKNNSLPSFFKENSVTVISSLPCYTASNTDKQRGEGVFSKSIEALKLLNEVGYGKEGSGLNLHLVYNPGGAFLPPSQEKLKADYQRELNDGFDVVFNDLYTITNMPISRYLDYLLAIGKLEEYMDKLISSFNPSTVNTLMCLNTLSVGWDGKLFDCDFNQMLEMPLSSGVSQYIKEYNVALLEDRRICTGQHCFGCTAGAGSSCQGSIV
ncbi:MAG: arsenosugar biosynthesis radical SAM protein ArsS [Flavobacteriales bacterium]|nr:arsenosugar biosynthesis radical SAM protein ArsS [Flavobacteriales bacterium]